MRQTLRVLCTTLGVAFLSAAFCQADPMASRQRYESIVTNLDSGGDLLVVANVEGYLQDLVSNLVSIAQAVPASGGKSAEPAKFINGVPRFLRQNGFYAVQGFGMSIVPRQDGLNTVKSFVARERSAASSPLWQGLVGGEPRALTCIGFVPGDAVLVGAGTADLSQLWMLVRAGVAELAPPQGVAGFERGLTSLSTNMGVNVDKMFASLGGESFFSVQLSKTSTVKIGENVIIPTPSLLMGAAVKDDTLIRTLDQFLARMKMPVVKTESEATTISSVNLPMGPLPIPVNPSYAVCSGFFLLGSSSNVVAAAIKAFKTKSGLSVTPEYRQAFAGMPAVNNGVYYMSPRYTQAMMDLQASMARSVPGAGGAEISSMVQSMFGLKKDMRSASVVLNRPDGVLSIGATTSGGREIAGAMLVAPVGIMAAIAIPSFVKARSTSQNHACINNLRIIDSAKEQWTMAERKFNGAEASIPGILEYIKGSTMPVCPQGGTYKINPIGVNPECSIPGHNLVAAPQR
jgi:hypothetical protein